jgi:hypothetical protein
MNQSSSSHEMPRSVLWALIRDKYGMPAADILADLQNRLEGSLP